MKWTDIIFLETISKVVKTSTTLAFKFRSNYYYYNRINDDNDFSNEGGK